jgi:hypothetical protein
MTLADRLPTMAVDALQSLRVNAIRLSAEPGTRGKEAGDLLPLIEAELTQREAAAPKKARAAPKKKKAAAALEEMVEEV